MPRSKPTSEGRYVIYSFWADKTTLARIWLLRDRESMDETALFELIIQKGLDALEKTEKKEESQARLSPELK